MIEPDFTYHEMLDEYGNICKKSWRYCGVLHNDNGPAQLHYSLGQLQFVVYIVHGKIHNENGPAITLYRSCGRVGLEYYAINGVLHRTDGPAICVYSSSDDHLLILGLNRINGIDPDSKDFTPHILDTRFLEKQQSIKTRN
jgi:hypothetical protein